jgi:hypothetical protein
MRGRRTRTSESSIPLYILVGPIGLRALWALPALLGLLGLTKLLSFATLFGILTPLGLIASGLVHPEPR